MIISYVLTQSQRMRIMCRDIICVRSLLVTHY